MTDCPNAEMRDLLPDLVGGLLAGEVRARVEAHVAGCGDCADERELLVLARSHLVKAPRIDVAAVAARVGERTAGGRGKVIAGAWGARPWRIAAGIAVLAIGAASASRMSWHLPAREGGAGGPPAAVSEMLRNGSAAVAAAGPESTLAGSARGGEPAASARRGLSLTGGISDLSDAQLEALLQELDKVNGVPSAEPQSLNLDLQVGEKKG